MKRFVPLLLIVALAGTALAQVSSADYQAWRQAERASYAPDGLTAYQAWRLSERASYGRLGSADLRAWLGGFSRQEIDTARRILPDVGYRSDHAGVYRAGRVSAQINTAGTWFTEGESSGVAAAVPQPESIILRGVADPMALTTSLPSTQAQPVYMPRKSEFFEP